MKDCHHLTATKSPNTKTMVTREKNKVDVLNNILHTLREASHVGEKAIFHFSFPATPPGLFRALMFKKSFWCSD